jgi:hypothetical protein
MADATPTPAKPKPDNRQRLTALLGGMNPSDKGGKLTATMFGEVVQKIKDQRMSALKARAEEQLGKAFEIVTQMDKIDADYKKEREKMDNGLGKLVSAIERMAAGKADDVDAEPAGDAPAADAAKA